MGIQVSPLIMRIFETAETAVDLEDLDYPSTFTAETMESMVESVVGDQLRKTDFSSVASGLEVKWGYKVGSEFVSISRKNDSTQRADLDLKLVYNYKFFNWDRTAKFELDVDMSLSMLVKVTP